MAITFNTISLSSKQKSVILDVPLGQIFKDVHIFSYQPRGNFVWLGQEVVNDKADRIPLQDFILLNELHENAKIYAFNGSLYGVHIYLIYQTYNSDGTPIQEALK